MTNNEYRILNYIDHIEARHTFPFFVEWHLTNRCNCRCDFCINNYFNKGRQEEPSVEGLLSICSQLIDNRIKAVLISGGGEPTLVPALPLLLSILKKNGIAVGLISNGYFLRDRSAIQAIIPVVSWIRISVDAGTDQTYTSTKKCNPERTLAALLDRLCTVKEEYGINPGIGYLITKCNYHEIDTFISETQQRGLDNYRFRFAIPFAQEEYLTDEELLVVTHQVSAVLTGEPASTITQGIIKSRENIYKNPTKGKCWCCRIALSISAYGDVAPCCQCNYVNKHVMGNVFSTPLIDIWNNRIYKQFRETGICSVEIPCKWNPLNVTYSRYISGEISPREVDIHQRNLFFI